MNKQQIDVLANCNKAFYELESFIKANPAINSPRTEKEYSKLAEDVMDIIREVLSEVNK